MISDGGARCYIFVIVFMNQNVIKNIKLQAKYTFHCICFCPLITNPAPKLKEKGAILAHKCNEVNSRPKASFGQRFPCPASLIL